MSKGLTPVGIQAKTAIFLNWASHSIVSSSRMPSSHSFASGSGKSTSPGNLEALIDQTLNVGGVSPQASSSEWGTVPQQQAKPPSIPCTGEAAMSKKLSEKYP